MGIHIYLYLFTFLQRSEEMESSSLDRATQINTLKAINFLAEMSDFLLQYIYQEEF